MSVRYNRQSKSLMVKKLEIFNKQFKATKSNNFDIILHRKIHFDFNF